MRMSAIIALLIAGGLIAPAQPSAAEDEGRIFATVLLVRGTVAGGNQGSYGLFVREDSGWVKVTRSNVISFGSGFGSYGGSKRHYLAAGNGLHRSTDGAKTWRVLTSWYTEEILGVVTDPIDSTLLYVATPFGVFKSTDDGVTWLKKNRGFGKWFIQRVIMDGRNRRVLFAASEDDVYRSVDGGEQWTPLHAGAPMPLALLQSPTEPSLLLAGFEDGGIRRSTDGGTTWTASHGLEGATVYALRASADGKDLYAAGWKTGLWRSEDGGTHWTQVWHDPAFDAIYSLFVHPRDPRHLMVGTVGAGVYESLDRGVTWHYAGLPGCQVKQIELYP